MPAKKSRISSWREHLAQDVEEAWSDTLLLVMCFVAGLVDSAVFNVWSCFVSMQTGKSLTRTSMMTRQSKILTLIQATRCTLAWGSRTSPLLSHIGGQSQAQQS